MSGAAPAAASPLARRIAPLDGLRGLAALGILLLHVFPAQLFWLWSCVDLFFVLSGYLITSILLGLDGAGVAGLRNFWIRRVLRIWPVYYLALAGAIGVALLEQHLGEARAYTWLRCFVFLQFVEGYFTGPAFEGWSYAPWFRHSWSLAVEEQFYLLWPLLLLLLGRRRPWVAAACVALGGLALALRAEGYALILMLTRVDGLAAGAVLAVLGGGAAAAGGSAHAWRGRACAVAAVTGALLVLRYLWQGYTSPALHGYGDLALVGDWRTNVTGFALLYVALVGAVVDRRLPRVAAVLGARPLVFLGSLSYATYMFNGPVRGLLHAVIPGAEAAPLAVELLAMPATLLAAYASRVLVERPCERLKRHFPLDLRPAPGGAGALPAAGTAPRP